MDFLDKLNPQQRKAVTAADGAVLVVAGPGSGKTRVLTQRVAYLIASEGVRPWQILAVTFTNKAAKEMDSRVKAMLNEQATDGIMLGTFHSICARILRIEAGYLPLQSNFVIFDSDDQEQIVKTIIKEFDLDEKLFRAASIHAAISRAKNELIGPNDYLITTYPDEIIKRIYIEYQKRMIASNAMDFDDLLVYTACLLRDNQVVRDKYAQKFRHVLVDEFQDTNLAQYELVKHLASHHRNVFCVGDEDQSVYSWRGADYRNILRFEQDFPNAKVVLLEENYRSCQNILDVATNVINCASNRRKKRLFSDRGLGEKIFLHEAYNDYDEATFVVDNIIQLISSKQFKPDDCAVMYRTNAMSRLIERAFIQVGFPYKLVGAQRFYGRREVKDIIAFIRFVHNPADEAALSRIISVPPRGIGKTTLIKLDLIANKAGASPSAILLDLAQGQNSSYYKSFASSAARHLAEFGKMLVSWRTVASSSSIVDLFDLILQDIKYKDFIIEDGSKESQDRWENVEELRRLAQEYSMRTLDEFLEDIALIADQDTITDTNAPTLLTLHAAKGLEFSVVFIIGLDNGVIPHSRSFEKPKEFKSEQDIRQEREQLEEERRLFYVGITRAKDRLYLVRALNRTRHGIPEETDPSVFLDAIPEELLNRKTRTGRPTSSFSSSRSFSRTPSPSESKYAVPPPPKSSPVANLVSSKFKSGDHIKHASFGEGIVQESRIQDNDEIVVIEFKSVGLKRLAASLANLQII